MKRTSLLETPEGTDTVRVLLVDEATAVLDQLAESLAVFTGIKVVGVAADGIQAIQAAWKLVPDVVVMDIRMPRLGGIQATREITSRQPSTAVLLHTEAR